MTDNDGTAGEEQWSADTGDASLTTAVASTYKILGQFAASDGAAVLGRNDATSGTPIGVQGAVPNADGYGLATPHDARIEGAVDTNGTDFVVEAGTTSTDDAKNVVMGHESNEATSGTVAATISGGGFDTGVRSIPNTVTGSYGTVGGGSNNTATNQATVSGGEDNTADGNSSTVGGGSNNEIRADYATIAGGGPTDTLSPGTTNNVVYDQYGTIGGGGDNQAGSEDGETDSATYATVSGGKKNEASGKSATVGGGESNTATALYATSSGGKNADATGYGATVSGGERTNATTTYATVGGGLDNNAEGRAATVPGGEDNRANGDHSFAAGERAKAEDNNAFVWADGATADDFSPVDFSSSSGAGPTGENTFSARATGGVRFVTGVDSNGAPDTGVKVSSGSGSWASLSTRTAKTNVRPTDPTAVLEAVESLEVNRWEYDSEADADHMGPMAEEFSDAFGLGSDDRHITNVDADGVAFAAIQGLADRLDEESDRLEAENERLREELAERDERVATLERRLDAVDARLETVAGETATLTDGESTSADD